MDKRMRTTAFPACIVNKQAAAPTTGLHGPMATTIYRMPLRILKQMLAVQKYGYAKETITRDEGGGKTNNERAASFIMHNNLGIYGGFNWLLNAI